MTAAYLLVAHGSRDPRPRQVFAHLSAGLADRLGCPVDWAMLEFAPVPLADRIVEFAQQHPGAHLAIAPFFLSSGVHVCEDIPEQLASARDKYASLNSSLAAGGLERRLVCLEHAGASIDFAQAASERFGRVAQQTAIDAWMTIAHGSRRAGGNTETDALGQRIQAAIDLPCDLAYWSREGDIAATVRHCSDRGHKRIGILPHFLFPGRITDAIAERINAIVAELPDIEPHPLPTWSEDLDWAIEAAATWLQSGVESAATLAAATHEPRS